MIGAAGVAKREPGAWQLEMLQCSLKKQQKLQLLSRMLRRASLEGTSCLLITNGDNTGALNYRFRELGGRWYWAEVDEAGISEMEAFLGEPVQHCVPERLPFADGEFDRVVVIDVHEHLVTVTPFNREIARILAPGGVALVTTPNGDRRLPVAMLKRWVGMSQSEYGHVVQGYRIGELETMLREVGLQPSDRGAYARFFTELTELAINFAYVKVLTAKRKGSAREGAGIAPRTADQLGAVSGSYRLYRAVFPLIHAFSALDAVLPGRGGYAVAVAARKAV